MTLFSKPNLLHTGVLLGLIVLYFVLPPYHSGNLSRIMVLAIYAMGYNVLFGYTGLLSLGHAMFFAAGMYGFGLAVNLGGITLPIAFILGILSAGILATVVGSLALRTTGVAFMIVTLMFAQTAYLVVLYLGEYTRGDEGFVVQQAQRTFAGVDLTTGYGPLYYGINSVCDLLFGAGTLGQNAFWQNAGCYSRERRTCADAGL
jgi:branched-chain amino acid transport system permease protein